MDLELTDEQAELRRISREALDRHAPLSLARSYLDGQGDCAPLWTTLAELGWYGVGLEQDDPFGVPGLCLLAEQVGRHVAPTLLIDTAVTARLMLDCGGDAQASWAHALAVGSLVASLALMEAGGDWSAEQPGCQAVPRGSGYRISGVKLGVRHAQSAGAFAVLAGCDGAPGLFLVDPAADGVAVTPVGGLDPATAACELSLEDVAVEAGRAAVGPAAGVALERMLAVATVATAAEGVGAASAALDLAVTYALEREQYGRVIGAFQAVAHMLADAHMLRETAWSTTLHAGAAIEEQIGDVREMTAVAKAYTSRASRQVAETALQVLGGIGFTWEHDHHLFHRRVLECEHRFGDALEHERRLGEALASRDGDWRGIQGHAPATASGEEASARP